MSQISKLPRWEGLKLLKIFFAVGAFSITFRRHDNVTVLVRFPAELRCVVFIEDNIHVPLIRWYREDGSPVDPYAI